jgi:hypothetical protein
MRHLTKIAVYKAPDGPVKAILLLGFVTSEDIMELIMLRDRLMKPVERKYADVIIDASTALIAPSAEGVIRSLGKQLAHVGKMLHLVIGEDNRPSMADLPGVFGVCYHKTMVAAMEAAGTTSVSTKVNCSATAAA